jgi:hypothetical protein
MERSFGTSRSSGSTRSSESRSSGESPTTPRDRHYGNTVGTIPRHDSGSTHSTELGKLRGLKVHIVKPQGKLTIKVPKGVSGELRDALGRAIHELLRVKGYLYDPNDLVHSVGVHEVKAFKTLHGTRYEVQYKITPRLEKEAKTYVASSIKNLLAQCNFIGLTEAQFIHLLDPKNDDLVRLIAGGLVDFINYRPHPDCRQNLVCCLRFALDQHVPRLAEIVLKDVEDYIVNPEVPILLDVALLHFPESLFNAARVAKTQDKAFLDKLIPLVSRMSNRQPEGLSILAEYCVDHPDRMERATACLSRERKEQLDEAVVLVQLRHMIAQGNYGKAGRFLVNLRRQGYSLPIDAKTIELVVEREFRFDPRHFHNAADLLLFLLCNRGEENDLQLAWTLYKAEVAAGGKPSHSCTQMVLERMERAIDPQALRRRSKEASLGEWSERFLDAAARALNHGNDDLALKYTELLIVLAETDQRTLAMVESFAEYCANEKPEFAALISGKIQEVLKDSEQRQQLLDMIAVELRWNSSLMEARRWFDGRELKASGLRQGEFEFRATNPDNPSSYNSFADSAMAIKMAEGWAVNPTGPLEQAFAILTYVMECAVADTKKRSEKTRRHAVSLMRAITELVAAVRHSPSEVIRNRDAELTAFLMQSADRATLFKRAYGDELPDRRPQSVSDKTQRRSRYAPKGFAKK